jgi:hypothetical protein
VTGKVKLVLRDVYVVLALSGNLLSVKALVSKGWKASHMLVPGLIVLSATSGALIIDMLYNSL